MGVPRLYKWLENTFPKHIYRTFVGANINWQDMPLFSQGKRPDNFYIDAVSILHNNAARVFKYGDHALKDNEEDEYAGLSEKQKIKKVYQLSMDYTFGLIRSVNPSKFVFYSLDGVAPLAKQGQQRQRRFISARSRAESKHIFDSNTITAGSKFTYDFSTYARLRFTQAADIDPFFKKLKIGFSSSNVAGEGEHKIMDYLRATYKTFDNQRHVLYGPDGDLIMLALCTHRKDFWIVRENFFDHTKFDIVNMGAVYRQLYEILTDGVQMTPTAYPPYSPKECNIKNVIHDFVLMCFFLGNDFLPKIAMIDMLEQGIEIIIDKYKKNKVERSKDYEWTLTNDGKINAGNFQHFINNISGFEKYFLIGQINYRPENEKFINKTLQDSCENVLNTDGEQKIFMNYDKYEKLYTERKLDNNPELAVEKYFEGLNWVLNYYTTGCTDWHWIYPYHHAPLMKHMAGAIRDTKIKNIEWTKNTAVSTFRQMMCVIPPASSDVLHEKLREIYQHPKLKNFYPSSFVVDYEGKRQDWQGIAMLPFIDQKKMDIVYQELLQKYPELAEVKENKAGKNYLIQHDENVEYNYKCKFGRIDEGEVSVQEITEFNF